MITPILVLRHCNCKNLLSYQVIYAIRFVLRGYVFPNIRLHSNISKFAVEAYKLTGKAEQTHGDIAIVVTRSFPGTGHPISGVGFYEAKALDYGFSKKSL